jgi:endonuclease/exonuclease/phosphatase (EEP) superfamily protein YafD
LTLAGVCDRCLTPFASACQLGGRSSLSFQPKRISRSAQITVGAPLDQVFERDLRDWEEAINHYLESGERKHLR